MLTSMHYYGYYRPYILKTNDIHLNKIATKKDIYTKGNSLSEEYSFVLNKAFNSEVVSYASSIFKNLNETKDVSNFISSQISDEKFDKNNKENIADGLDDFVTQYNECSEFLDTNTEISNKFLSYSEGIQTVVSDNSETLDDLGLRLDEKGKISFNREKFLSKTFEEIIDSRTPIKDVFNKIYDLTVGNMKNPPTEHMNFKDFKYYFNYSTGYYETSFKLLEAGIVVDIRV